MKTYTLFIFLTLSIIITRGQENSKSLYRKCNTNSDCIVDSIFLRNCEDIICDEKTKLCHSSFKSNCCDTSDSHPCPNNRKQYCRPGFEQSTCENIYPIPEKICKDRKEGEEQQCEIMLYGNECFDNSQCSFGMKCNEFYECTYSNVVADLFVKGTIGIVDSFSTGNKQYESLDEKIKLKKYY